MTDTSTIHDLSYRRYHGVRVGPSGAWRALYVQGMRSMFGFGRPFKSKMIPVIVVVLSLLPVMASLTFASASNGAAPLRYGMLIGGAQLLFVLFVSAQVPEVFSRDQQHRVLALIFTRDVTRNAYAFARFAAILTSVFLVAFLPLLILYLGQIGIAADPSIAFDAMGGRIGPVLAQSSLTAFALSGISSAIAVWTPRRGYASIAIFGVFLLLAAVATGMDSLADMGMRSAELLDPIRAMRTMAMLLFKETNASMAANPPFALIVYVQLLLGIGASGLAVLVYRVRRLAA